MKNDRVPDIRFQEFTEEWKLSKLGDISDKVTRKNINLESTLPLTISAQHGLVDQNTFFNRQVASKDVSGYYLLKNGEFAYNKSYSLGYPWGAVKRLDKYELGVLSTLYILFKVINVNSDFLVSYYDTDRWHKEVSMRATEGARNHGLLNISSKDFFETELRIPLNQKEQTKIGNFFKQLDNTISIHQRELDNLKEVKKGFLQKMFPKEGETVPEIRFGGFTGDWKQKKLGDMGNTYTGLSGKSKEDFGHGEGEYITYINVYANSIAKRNGTEKIEIDDKQNQVRFGDMFFTTSSETPDEVGLSSVWLENTENVYLNSFCFGYRPLNNIDLYFMAFIMRSPEIRKKFIILAQGISRYNISKSRVLDLTISVPDIKEQKMIGQFFKQFDEHIHVKEKKIDLLKQTKKAFLQKMFV